MQIKNPFTMWGRIERCWLLAYRAPLSEINALLPPPLEAVSREGFGFYNVVICRIKDMRPWPLPGLFGFSYWHVAYRIYVRFRSREGDCEEGLYFLRSDCDKDWLVTIGNKLTDFRFHSAKLQFEENATQAEEKTFRICSHGSDAVLRIEKGDVSQPEEGSVFAGIREAEAFLKYKPKGIGFPAKGLVQVVNIERDERAWKHRLVRVKEQNFDFLQGSGARFELCYEVGPIDYVWKKGRSVGYA